MSTLFGALAQWAEAQPDTLALITETDGTRTYAELVHNAAAIGGALYGFELSPGATVTLLAANSPQWVETYLGVGAAGLRCVSGNPEWTDSEISFILEHSESSAVICDSELAERVVALKRDLPGLRHVIAIADPGEPAGRGPCPMPPSSRARRKTQAKPSRPRTSSSPSTSCTRRGRRPDGPRRSQQ